MRCLYLCPEHVLLTVLLVLINSTCLAFEEEKDIDDITLFDETFLDINADDFRKSQDLAWLDSLSGWRMGGGSTATDYLFLQTDLKLNHQLSDSLYFGLDLNQYDFYTTNPLEAPLIFVDVYPFKAVDIGFSFIGTAAVDKRQADLGFAFTVGRRPRNYVRFSWLSQDHYFNEKNSIDDAYYDEPGERMMLQGLYDFGKHWEISFDFEKETPSEYVFDDQVTHFNNEFGNYLTSVIYHINAHAFSGIDIHTMNRDKTLSDATRNETQEVDYFMVDVYWVNGVDQEYELTVGVRYDDFEEAFRDRVNQARDYNFQLWTAQAYSSVYHSYSVHQAWDMGLYLGWSERDKIYLTSSNADDLNEGVQAKLRGSWEYHSADKKSQLDFSISLNLDELFSDPGDGGGINFQTLF